LYHEDQDTYSTPYFTYLENSDITKILELSGFLDNEVSKVYGNFVLLDDNSLRLLMNPKYAVVENVDKVYMCDF